MEDSELIIWVSIMVLVLVVGVIIGVLLEEQINNELNKEKSEVLEDVYVKSVSRLAYTGYWTINMTVGSKNDTEFIAVVKDPVDSDYEPLTKVQPGRRYERIILGGVCVLGPEYREILEAYEVKT